MGNSCKGYRSYEVTQKQKNEKQPVFMCVCVCMCEREREREGCRQLKNELEQSK